MVLSYFIALQGDDDLWQAEPQEEGHFSGALSSSFFKLGKIVGVLDSYGNFLLIAATMGKINSVDFRAWYNVKPIYQSARKY